MGESRHFIYRRKQISWQVKRFLRKLSIIATLLFLAIKAPAPGLSVFYIFTPKSLDPYEKLINAVIRVESSGNYMAFNEIEEAYGAFQIRPIRVQDYNQRTGKNYKAEDCFSYDISNEIFRYYAHISRFRDFETIARNWNGSGKMTLVYWDKVKLHL